MAARICKQIGYFSLMLLVGGCGGDRVRLGDVGFHLDEVFENPQVRSLARAAARGDDATVSRILDGGVEVDSLGFSGITPLWWTVVAKNYEGYLSLLERGANPNFLRQDGMSVLTLVSRMQDERFLVAAMAYGGDPNFRDNPSSQTPLFQTAIYGRLGNMEILLANGASPDAQDIAGWTAAMYAIASRGDFEMVWLLVNANADPRLLTNNGKSLADIIELRAVDPNSDSYLWREKVIHALRAKGIEVHRPSRESPRSEEER